MANQLAKKRYLPSYKRSQTPPPIRLTQRDKDILVAIQEYRLLSAHQIEALLFSSEKTHGKRTVCQRRLQLLFHHGFIDRLASPVVLGEGRFPYVYVLDEPGASLVASQTGVDRAGLGWKPQDKKLGVSFVQHSLAVNDVRLVFNLLAQADHFTVAEWIGEADFRTTAYAQRVPSRMQGARTIRIYPDGYCAIQLPEKAQAAHFFLEVDQGTMSNQRWQDKMKAYDQFRHMGRSLQLYGTQHFRVLAIASSHQRLQNLKKATEKVGRDQHFWFTTQDKVDIWHPQMLLEPIWHLAGKEGVHSLFS